MLEKRYSIRKSDVVVAHRFFDALEGIVAYEVMVQLPSPIGYTLSPLSVLKTIRLYPCDLPLINKGEPQVQ